VARNRPDPHKKRTREHVIADQSVAHVTNVVVRYGYTVERRANDYGIDLAVHTYNENGYPEEGEILLQLKATDALTRTRQGITHRIDARDYRQWTGSPMPVFLIVYDAPADVAYWLYIQHYFEADAGRRPAAGARTVTVTIPPTNVVNAAFVSYARGRRADIIRQFSGRIRHNG
jgi:Domain of unknown function (DUF4365)